MSDRDIKVWDQRLLDQAMRRWENYRVLTFDLTTARDNVEINEPGDCLIIIGASNKTANAEVKFNLNTMAAVPIFYGRQIETVFKNFYLSNDAQSGMELVVLIGINCKVTDTDAANALPCNPAPTITMTNAVANANTVCASNAAKFAIIKACVWNTGVVWVDFGAAAVQFACQPLDPGDWLIVELDDTGLINANFEVADELLYVTYEN